MKSAFATALVIGCGTEFSTLGLSVALPDGGAPDTGSIPYDAYVPGAGGSGGALGGGDSRVPTGGRPQTGGAASTGGHDGGTELDGAPASGGTDAGAGGQIAAGGALSTGGARPTGGASSGGTGTGGAPVDACAPKSCDEQGRICGGGSDLCGRPLHCGLCPSGERCEQGNCVCSPSSCPFCVFGPACCTTAGVCACPPNCN